MTTSNLKISRSNWSPARRTVFGEARYEAKGTFGPRVQPEYQFVLMLEGDVRVDLESVGGQAKTIHIPPMHVGLMRPGVTEKFFFSPVSAVHHTWCSIRPELLSPEEVALVEASPQVIPLSGRLRNLVELGLGFPGSDSIEAGQSIISFSESLAKAVLHSFLFESSSVYLPLSIPDPVRLACHFIEEHLSESISLVEISEAAFVSKQHLTRLFQQHYRVTPVRYLWNRRTEKGAELLRETGIPIAKISELVGFQSPFHFSRWVKQKYAMSPRQLRQRSWGMD